MPKINVKITLTTADKVIEKIYNAIFHPTEQEVIYQEEDKTKVKINLKEMKLRRENKELWMEYTFEQKKTTIGIIKIKQINKEIMLKIKTKKISKKNKNIKIEYQLEDENYQYELEVIA